MSDKQSSPEHDAVTPSPESRIDRVERLERELKEALETINRQKALRLTEIQEYARVFGQARALAEAVGEPELEFSDKDRPASDASYAMHQVKAGIEQLKVAATLPDLGEAYPLVFQGKHFMAINIQDPNDQEVLESLVELHNKPAIAWHVGPNKMLKATFMSMDGDPDVGAIVRPFGGEGRESLATLEFNFIKLGLMNSISINDFLS